MRQCIEGRQKLPKTATVFGYMKNGNAVKSATLVKQLLKNDLFAVVIFSVAIFLPMMGRGFIHDDFVHLCSASYDSVLRGLTHATGETFYAPIAWLSFKLDYILWGKSPFPLACTNLLLHILNISLLYILAIHLWRSSVAARWTAIGFAMLFPANTWAVMWIATRAHLLATFFYLAAMIMTVWFSRTDRHRFFAAVAIVCCAALSIFSKESGVTIPLTICLVLLYERRSKNERRIPPITKFGLFMALFAVLFIYAILRAQSGAIPVTANKGPVYSYSLSLNVFLENLFRYGWRTYGILTIVGCAVALSQLIIKRRLDISSLTKNEVLFSGLLFTITISPFILIMNRSGIYPYLPGIAAALLLGVSVRAFYETTPKTPSTMKAHYALLAKFPIMIVFSVCALLTVGHSIKRRQMAEVNTIVLKQIRAQQPEPEPNSVLVLKYSKADELNRFPNGFAEWGFPYAIKLLYSDPTLNALIIKQGETYSTNNRPSITCFIYTLDDGERPRVIKTSESSCAETSTK